MCRKGQQPERTVFGGAQSTRWEGKEVKGNDRGPCLRALSCIDNLGGNLSQRQVELPKVMEQGSNMWLCISAGCRCSGGRW